MKTLIAAVAVVALLTPIPASALGPPSNDDAASATAIGALPFAASVDTSAATTGPEDPSGCGLLTRTVWYTYNAGPAGNDHVYLSANRASAPPYSMVVLEGSPSGKTVACAGNYASLRAKPSVTYFIVVGNGTQLNFSATQGVVFGGSVEASAAFDPKSGSVALAGTYTCNLPSVVGSIVVALRQQVGRFAITAGPVRLWVTSRCNPGVSYPWSVLIAGESGKFKGGRATASVVVNGQQDGFQYGWDTDLGSFALHLKRLPHR